MTYEELFADDEETETEKSESSDQEENNISGIEEEKREFTSEYNDGIFDEMPIYDKEELTRQYKNFEMSLSKRPRLSEIFPDNSLP